MKYPLVSVVIETVTAREDHAAADLADQLRPSLAGLDGQTWPQASIERLVVVDGGVTADQRAQLVAAFPGIRLVEAAACNYFEAKNAGARAARGAYVALIDGDCAPDPAWLAELVSAMEPGVDAVAGRTRYAGKTWAEKICSIPDFAQVVDGGDGQATGFNINNLMFRRDVLLAFPFEPRIVRNGGCVFLFHQLRHAGKRVVYNPEARVAHGDDVSNLGFVRKHFERGYDGVTLYRLDEPGILRGTRLFRRLGPIALVGLAARRVALDLVRLVRSRRQMGVSLLAVPFYWLVWSTLRAIELCGALTAVAAGDPRPREA